MSWQMNDNALFAILLRSRWWVSVLIAGSIGLVSAALLPPDWRLVGALSGFPFLVVGAIAARRQWRLPSDVQVQRAADTLSTLAWPAFEAQITQGFEREGYIVKQLPKGRGADLTLERRGQCTVVAARRWKSARIGVESLKPLQAARDSLGADAAVFIGLGVVSDQARHYAAENGLRIWQAADLLKLAAEVRPR